MAPTRRTCAAPDCTVRFVPQRSTAKYHSSACRKRAAAKRSAPKPPPKKTATPARKKAAATKATPAKRAPAKKTTPPPETKTEPVVDDGLEGSVRRELEKAEAVDTFAGQLALQLARRLVTPDETGISSLSKELRTVMAAALQGVTPPAAAAETEDEVEKARRKREEARQAAGLT